MEWQLADASAVPVPGIEQGIRGSAALDPTRATCTTARDMCALLRLIWDRPGIAR